MLCRDGKLRDWVWFGTLPSCLKIYKSERWATKAARKRAAQDAVGEVVEEITPAAKVREEVSTVRDTPDTVRLQDIHRMDPTTDDYVATVNRAYDALPDGIRNIELDDDGTTPSRMVQAADDELARLEGFQACLLGAD
jgi:hypothetical protein